MPNESATSFEDFVVADLPRLLGFACALAGSRHDGWDLTQETLARVGVRWARIDRQGNPGGYARTTMVRLNIDRIRRSHRERSVADPPEMFAAAQGSDRLDSWLVDGLATLSPRQRTAVVLRYVVDLDVAAIALEMGCSAGTAKSHLSRGLDRLRQHASSVTSLDLSVKGA